MTDFSQIRMNRDVYGPLGVAHDVAVRRDELYACIAVLDRCGPSPEVTEAIGLLGKRYQRYTDILTQHVAWALDPSAPPMSAPAEPIEF